MPDRRTPWHPPQAVPRVGHRTCDHDPDPSWSDCAVLDGPPERWCPKDADDRADDGSCAREEARYLEYSESGWSMMILWAAGTEHIVRCLETRPPPPVRVTHVREDGTEQRWELERTRHDQADIDLFVDTVLGEAGVPAQPSGYRWFLRLPDSCRGADDFAARLRAALGPGRLQTGPPSEDLAAFRRAFAVLYGGAPPDPGGAG
ncbi:hypothetical protein CLV63_103271 [Murinocardiopsis flavida]|uniref:Uncharacterized protein n=1 Tax=Murinocardiopsis flavida TaxID=645275 RepID=A0A2P8DQQ0_9ACTN|nr:DUF5956 family protein [Murinocardiopsis flavida]PSK99546.1 hypothetical protein CLV63_103271 [Murinocardiopsis flavida]